MDAMERIDALDISIFDGIPSLTTAEGRRSLLAVQLATARLRGWYSYLEIGSHLGGTIQPHLRDIRCEKIFSIDPRPEAQPDERAPGHLDRYQDNSTDRMLALLAQQQSDQVGKIECFECCSWEVPAAAIAIRPHLVFIDGEHTTDDALADFRFAMRVVVPGGRSDPTTTESSTGPCAAVVTNSRSRESGTAP